jgi:hypothetical protein
MESNVRYWRKQKELLKHSKSDSSEFRCPKDCKIRILYATRFFSGQTEKKSAQITRVNTAIVDATS